MKKWFFLASFIAATFCSLLDNADYFRNRHWSVHKPGSKGGSTVSPLLFFIYGARAMFHYFKDAREN
jgi:hypothetical protein